ncbi:methyl-CpG-binding domain protein 2-like [Babylonia areolata]|uniref:methyl-CpG-binding domain protein 2-like n=1 Tax=Babylonia areolata TaxID=304850 RepID=UPI003FD55537
MALPPGWKREEVVRQSGLSAGKTDVYYYSPDGKKIRSKPQLARLLGDTFDLSAFDFRTGRVIYSAVRKSKRQKGSAFDFARGVRVDSSLVLPIRQTASIFKQPVTVIRNNPESKTKTDLKHGVQEQPRQLFWEKRLQGLRACDSTEEAIQSMELPRNMNGVGPELTTESVLQSVSASLHLNNVPVTGQSNSRSQIQKNPGVNIDTSQPHIQHILVSEEDIQRQEQRVVEARRRLQDALREEM